MFFSLTDASLKTREKIKETIILSLLNVVLPSVDVYSDIALVVNFLVGSRRNPYCVELFPSLTYNSDFVDRLNCYYNDSVPTTNVTYTSHYGWASMMFVPFLFNYLICWYVWATTGITTQLFDTKQRILPTRLFCPSRCTHFSRAFLCQI